MRRWTGPRIVAVIIGLVFVVSGIWAMSNPMSFYTNVATYPPYNEHLWHDIGAFQIGLGATLLFTFFWTDAPLVALAGVGVGSVLHFVAHVIDRGQGGKSTDPLSIGLVAAVVAAAALWRAAQLRRGR